jgi:hypothetical protein
MQLLRRVGNFRNALPVRFDSTHVCYNDPLMVPFFSLAMIIMGTRNRMRFRAHYGSDEECRLQLSTFGIPISALPVSPRGEFNLENHWAFVAMQRSIEATKSKRKGPLRILEKRPRAIQRKRLGLNNRSSKTTCSWQCLNQTLTNQRGMEDSGVSAIWVSRCTSRVLRIHGGMSSSEHLIRP